MTLEADTGSDGAGGLSRRSVLVGGAAVCLAAPFVWPSDRPSAPLRLGCVAQQGLLPILAARSQGFFAAHGLANVQVIDLPSWGALDDHLSLGGALGGVDGGPVVLDASADPDTGSGGSDRPLPFKALCPLDPGPSVVLLAEPAARGATGLAAWLRAKRPTGAPVIAAMALKSDRGERSLADVLRGVGLDPVRNLRSVVIPAPHMAANLAAGAVDLVIVDAVWADALEASGLASALAEHASPAIAFGLRRDRAAAHPEEARALSAAIRDAQRWLADPCHGRALRAPGWPAPHRRGDADLACRILPG